MTVAIHGAGLSDLEVLAGVFRRASLSNDGDRPYLLAHPEVLVLSDAAIREGRTLVALEPGGGIVGFASWAVHDRALEVEDLFVEPRWMRQGIGRALVLAIAEIGRRQGFERLEVTANPHARVFYESAGFTADHEVATRFSPGRRMHMDLP